MKKFIFILLIVLFNFCIGKSQNVGIDVSNPLGKLHIKTNSSTEIPQLRLTEINDDYARIKLESEVNPLAFWDIAAKADTVTADSRLNFYFSNPYNGGDRLTITGIGNVGIGNLNPLSKLDIKGIGDGVELLRFTTDRPWVFKQTSSGISTRLTLQSTINDKTFDIVAPNGTTKLAEFFTRDIDPEITLLAQGGRLGIGGNSPTHKVKIYGNDNITTPVLSVSTTYLGNTDVRAIEGIAYPATGRGFGARLEGGARGVQASAYGNASTDWSIGVEASAYGSAGTRIGIFGRGTGGLVNWAGYFAEGNVLVTNDLRIGLAAIDGATGYKVAVAGKIIAEEVRVQNVGAWPDYVFKKSYTLMPLLDLEKVILQKGHLPGIPSATEVEKEGIMLGDMQRLLLEKIEELTLYTIELQKQVETLKTEMKSIQISQQN